MTTQIDNTSYCKNSPSRILGGYFIVTGASGSMGSEIVKSLLQRGFSVIMACRNLEKGSKVQNEILQKLNSKKPSVLLAELDMSSFDSIRKFVETIAKMNLQLTGLMNNAGTINRDFKLTPNGIEETMAVNYFGVILLTDLLMPLLEDGAGITNVVSMTTNPKRISKNMFKISQESYKQLEIYGRSKTALLLYTALLAERTEGKFHVNAADPGIVDTNILKLNRWFDPLADLLFRPLIKSPKKGAIPLLNALLSQKNGKVFYGNKWKDISGKYTNHSLKEWFWDNSFAQLTSSFSHHL